MRIGRKLVLTNAFVRVLVWAAGVPMRGGSGRCEFYYWASYGSIAFIHYIICLGMNSVNTQFIILAQIVFGWQASPAVVAGGVMWFCRNALLFGFCCLFPCVRAFSKCLLSFDVSRSWWGVILHKETGKELQLPYLLFSLSAPWLSPLLYSLHQVFITFNSLPFWFSSVISHLQG